jgi:hypothetical protein
MEYGRIRNVVVAGLFALSFPLTANALVMNTDGVWTSAKLDNGSNASGVGTDTIKWGGGSAKSSYVFDGTNITLDSYLTNGQAFSIGTFTHNNKTINYPSLKTAVLDIDIGVGGTTYKSSLNFAFKHNETPNNGNPCSGTGITTGVACPDIVEINKWVNNLEQVAFNGKLYELNIFGFKQSATGEYTTKFVTTEGLSNSTNIYAQFTQVGLPPVSVSKPGALAFIGLGLLGLGLARRKTKIA